jgi:hypothetical protein
MRLDQRDERQRECGQETKRHREVLRQKKSAKTKHPSHHYHDLELTRGVRFQNLEGHEDDENGNARLNALEGTVTEKDGGECHRRQNEFPNRRAKAIPFWLHPKFHREREQKETWNPGRERAEHWRQCEEQRGRQPKQRLSRNTRVPWCPHWNRLSARMHWWKCGSPTAGAISVPGKRRP